MCNRTADELLAAPGETIIVGPEFSCDAFQDPDHTARFHIIGFGFAEDVASGIVALKEAELAEMCEQYREHLPSVSPDPAQGRLHPVVYLSSDGFSQDTMIRLVFESQIAGGGLIVTNCEQATRVDASQVCFWRPH
jgi:hypothetical protein